MCLMQYIHEALLRDLRGSGRKFSKQTGGEKKKAHKIPHGSGKAHEGTEAFLQDSRQFYFV